MTNDHRGEDSRHVVHGLVGQLEIPVSNHLRGIARSIGPHFAKQLADAAFATVVGGHREEPVVEFAVEVRKIPDCGFRGHLGITAHVDPEIHIEAIALARLRNKLPKARRLRTAIGLHLESRFHEGQVDKVLRELVFFELRINQRVIGGLAAQRALDKALGLGREVIDFLQHALVELHGQRKLAYVHGIEEAAET